MREKLEAFQQIWLVLVVVVVPPLAYVLLGLINGLTKYTPTATGWITALRIVLDMVAPLANSDSPKTVKLGRSKPPGSSRLEFPDDGPTTPLEAA